LCWTLSNSPSDSGNDNDGNDSKHRDRETSLTSWSRIGFDPTLYCSLLPSLLLAFLVILKSPESAYRLARVTLSMRGIFLVANRLASNNVRLVLVLPSSSLRAIELSTIVMTLAAPPSDDMLFVNAIFDTVIAMFEVAIVRLLYWS
jgi:hypothetical protein